MEQELIEISMILLILITCCKMADSTLVLNNVLCFVINKFNTTSANLLKSMLMDFYDTDILCEAKVRLISDIGLNSMEYYLRSYLISTSPCR